MDKAETVDTISAASLESLFSRQASNIDKAIDANKAFLSDFATQLEKLKTSYRVDAGPEKEAEVEEKPAKAELADMSVAKTFNQVTGFEIWGIPIGSAVLGGFAAIFATELVDGYLKNQSVMVRGAVKLVGAGVIVKFGGKYLGKDVANTIALLMAFDGLKNDIMPSIFAYATQWANKLTGTVTTAGLGWTGGPARVVIPTGMPSGSRGDYYAASGLG